MVINALAYYSTELIEAVTSFAAQPPGIIYDRNYHAHERDILHFCYIYRSSDVRNLTFNASILEQVASNKLSLLQKVKHTNITTI